MPGSYPEQKIQATPSYLNPWDFWACFLYLNIKKASQKAKGGYELTFLSACLKAEIVGPEETAVAGQRLGKYVHLSNKYTRDNRRTVWT
jgi:hypothetical protein